MRRKHKGHIAGIIIILAFVVSACIGCTDHGLKKTLERYESLADAYIDFVEKYGRNPEFGTYPESEFMELMSEWADVSNDVKNIDTSKLSEEDVLYFMEVVSRVSLRLNEMESGDTQTDLLQNVPPETSPDISLSDSEAGSGMTGEQNGTWQNYSNSKEGISFRFPNDWSLGDLENREKYLFKDEVVAPEEEGFSANMSVTREAYDATAEFMMTCTEDELLQLYGQIGYENTVIYGLTDVMIDGVPAREQCVAFDLTDTESSFSGRFFVIIYSYIHDNHFYVINCATLESLSDKYVPIFKDIMDSYSITALSNGLDSYNNAMSEGFCYGGIPATELLELSAAEIVDAYFGGGYDTDGNSYIWYDDIGFYLSDDETVDRIMIYNAEGCSINGEFLKANQDGVTESQTIIDLFGQDYVDEWLDTGYFMTYHYPAYLLSFEVNKYNQVCSIMLRHPGAAESGSDLGARGSMAESEPIEDYDELAGKYDGTGQSSLSLSIFSSQEEGETAIGNIRIYLENGQSYEGEVFPAERDGYQVVTQTGEEIRMMASKENGIIRLQLYVDGQYVDEFWMAEHFQS